MWFAIFVFSLSWLRLLSLYECVKAFVTANQETNKIGKSAGRRDWKFSEKTVHAISTQTLALEFDSSQESSIELNGRALRLIRMFIVSNVCVAHRIVIGPYENPASHSHCSFIVEVFFFSPVLLMLIVVVVSLVRQIENRNNGREKKTLARFPLMTFVSIIFRGSFNRNVNSQLRSLENRINYWHLIYSVTLLPKLLRMSFDIIFFSLLLCLSFNEIRTEY